MEEVILGKISFQRLCDMLEWRKMCARMVMQTPYFPDQILSFNLASPMSSVTLNFIGNAEDQTLSSKDPQFSLADK